MPAHGIDRRSQKLHVAHAGEPQADADHILERVRQTSAYKQVGETTTLLFNSDALRPKTLPFVYDPASVDPVLFELLCAARFLADAPDVQRLEMEIRNEIADYTA